MSIVSPRREFLAGALATGAAAAGISAMPQLVAAAPQAGVKRQAYELRIYQMASAEMVKKADDYFQHALVPALGRGGHGAGRRVHRISRDGAAGHEQREGRCGSNLRADSASGDRCRRRGSHGAFGRRRISEGRRRVFIRAAEGSGVCRCRGATDACRWIHAGARSDREKRESRVRASPLSQSERSGVSQETRNVCHRRGGHLPPRRPESSVLRRNAVWPGHAEHHLHAGVRRYGRSRSSVERIPQEPGLAKAPRHARLHRRRNHRQHQKRDAQARRRIRRSEADYIADNAKRSRGKWSSTAARNSSGVQTLATAARKSRAPRRPWA